MKKLALLLAIVCMFQTYAQEKLPIDLSKSEIKWSCDYSFYFNGHFGYVHFKEGHFLKHDGKLVGGSFTIDLNTIMATDMNEKGNKGLTEHLKDPDFFDVKKYPEATLKIQSIEYIETKKVRVRAELTIKGITEIVKFDADLDYENKTFKTRFKIDRTRWGINYNSAIKDSAISDAIGFEVVIRL